MSRLAVILFISIISLSVSSASAAETVSASDALRLFAQCDASLFKALKENPGLFGSAVEVKNRGNAATIAVANPLSEKGRDQIFKEPAEVNELRLTAWRDEVSYDIELGGFLFWGFRAEGDLNTVAKKLNAVLPESQILVKEGDSWARPEIRMIGDPVDGWRPNRASSGTVTPKGSVERVLLLESEAPGQTNIFCTLQGSITPPLLQALRPDLSSAEYPQ